MTFTIKLHGRIQQGLSRDDGFKHTTKLIEASEVDIHLLRPGELWEVCAVDGPKGPQAFYIANPTKRPDGFATEVFFWDSAYVENAHGRTTDQVRF